MPRKHYTKDDHERAFQLYFEHRTYQKVADEMGIDYGTVLRWAKEDFDCTHPGCNYHGWDKLIEEKDRAIEARLKLYDEIDLDPVHHDQAVRGVVTQPDLTGDLTEQEKRRRIAEADRRHKVIESLVRSDLERLAQWEWLWSKIMFHATGMVLDYNAIVGVDGSPMSEEEVRKLLGRGLKTTTMEGAVRALKEVQSQIEILKEKIGLQKKVGNEDIGTGQTTDDSRPEMTIEDMRNFKELLENTPPEKRALLVKLFKADERALQVLSHGGQGSTGVHEAAQPADAVSLSAAQ
jgi:hypothetical protein